MKVFVISGTFNLNLSSCEGITDAGLSHLGNLHSPMQEINLSDCNQITNAGLSHLGTVNLSI
jgi:hypothetical protein